MWFLFKSFIHRGVGMVLLQILRVFTVISLGAGAVGFGVLMVKVSQKTAAYFPFEAASNLVMALISVVLILSEYPMLKFVKNFFRQSWPLFSDQHGLTWLGITMFLLGCNLIGALNQPAYEEKLLGTSLWQLVLAGGILNLVFGGVNILCSFTWSDRKNGINARDVRSKGSLAGGKEHLLPDHISTGISPASSIRNEKVRSKVMSVFWRNRDDTGRDLSRFNISGPLPVHQDVERDADGSQRGSPIVPGIKRPDTALHPMHTGQSSRYSEADISRF